MTSKFNEPVFNKKRAIGLIAASSIGTGIFTTTGFALRDLHSPWLVISLWILGGIYAMLGVYSYTILHKKYPGSGGEYHFLSKGIHPYLGIFAGFGTILMGFTAPLAATCMAFSIYFLRAFDIGLNPTLISFLVLSLIFCIHWLSLNKGMKWHDSFIYLKLLLFIILIFIAFLVADWRWPETHFEFNIYTYASTFFWIAYAYSGWNSVYYVASELTKNTKEVDRSSFLGSSMIVVLYVFLNIPLVFGISTEKLQGVTEVVAVFFEINTGYATEKIISAVIALGLFSTISAFLIIAPRVYSRMAEDKILPQYFYFAPGAHPRRVLFFQFILTSTFILLFDFESILKVAGFVLTSCSLLSVISLYMNNIKTLKLKEWLGTLSYVLLTSVLIYLGGPWF